AHRTLVPSRRSVPSWSRCRAPPVGNPNCQTGEAPERVTSGMHPPPTVAPLRDCRGGAAGQFVGASPTGPGSGVGASSGVGEAVEVAAGVAGLLALLPAQLALARRTVNSKMNQAVRANPVGCNGDILNHSFRYRLWLCSSRRASA